MLQEILKHRNDVVFLLAGDGPQYYDVVNAIREYVGHDKKVCSIRDRKKV